METILDKRGNTDTDLIYKFTPGHLLSSTDSEVKELNKD